MKTKIGHLQELKNILTIDKYNSNFQYVTNEDIQEIEKYIVLSLKLFNQLKNEGYQKEIKLKKIN